MEMTCSVFLRTRRNAWPSALFAAGSECRIEATFAPEIRVSSWGTIFRTCFIALTNLHTTEQDMCQGPYASPKKEQAGKRSHLICRW